MISKTSISKTFPVFDCDAHINDPLGIWEYVPERDQELVRSTYWRDDNVAFVNGTMPTRGGGPGEFAPMYNPICVAGPQMNKRLIRRLMEMAPLDDEQRRYLEHQGAYNARARLRDLDLMGIDQVLVIPTKILANLPFAENAEGAAVFARAYNSFVADWCSEAPTRLFPAAILPLQDVDLAVAELEHVAGLGFPVALIRPIDARGQYPRELPPGAGVALGSAGDGFGRLFDAFEDTDVVLGMHTFPAHKPFRTAGPGLLASPGELLSHAGVDSQTLSFVYEAQDWLAQTLLSGFLDRHPRLRMAIYESNATWLPSALDSLDRYFRLYARQRVRDAVRLPSEAFREQCVISFESDEVGVFEQWRWFEDLAIWSSDCYHADASDAWSAIREMTEIGVPEPVQAKFMGTNACRYYGIGPETHVRDEPESLVRPEWFPKRADVDTWVQQASDPRGTLEAASVGPSATERA